MRRISIGQIKPGMVVAKDVFGGSGQTLLREGASLKPHYARYLQNLGINYIYVRDSRLEGVQVEDVIAEATRQEARSLLREITAEWKSSARKKSLLLRKDEKIDRTILKIINELLNNNDVIVNLVDIRSINDYTFAHSVNTCILSILTATKLEYPLHLLKKNAVGFLLHDLGNITVPKGILAKPGGLEEEEYEVVKKHALYGYEIFRESPLFTSVAGKIIYQHHEREDGSGYPQGLGSNDIHFLAKVTAVADVYDALTSDRQYRKAYQPHQAIEMLTAMGERYFDLNILRTFLSFIAPYPVGTHVLLSNGESGLVINNTQGYPLRPVVRILYEGESLALHPSPYEVDLTEALDLVIEKVIE